MCDVCVETSELVTVCVSVMCVVWKDGGYKLLQHPECKKKCHT